MFYFFDLKSEITFLPIEQPPPCDFVSETDFMKLAANLVRINLSTNDVGLFSQRAAIYQFGIYTTGNPLQFLSCFIREVSVVLQFLRESSPCR